MVTDDLNELENEIQKYLTTDNLVAFDVETTGLNPRTKKLVLLQFYQLGREPFLFDMRDQARSRVASIILPLFSGDILVCGYNLKFDFLFLLEQLGIRAERNFDCYVAERLLYSADDSIEYGLDKVAARYKVDLEFPNKKEDRRWFENLDQRPEWGEDFPAHIVRYAENDVLCLPQIKEQQCTKLRESRLIPTAQLEFNLIPALVKLEADGVPIDVTGWQREIDKHKERAKELEEELLKIAAPIILSHHADEVDKKLKLYKEWEESKKAYEQQIKADHREEVHGKWGQYKIEKMRAWRENNPAPKKPTNLLVNIKSPAQLLLVLKKIAEDEGWEEVTDTGDKTLAKLPDHLFVNLLRKYRKENKFVTSYGEKLLAEQDEVTGRFHFNYNQIVSTGRMSASRIQQIPKKGEGSALRSCVVAEEGSRLITCDYPAIEMRILAEISDEPGLIRIFQAGLDIHSEIARDLFKLSPTDNPKTKEAIGSNGKPLGKTCREIAKQVEYASVYGISPRSLAELLGIQAGEAKTILSEFFKTYPNVRKYLTRQKRRAMELGETRTPGGRIRKYNPPTKPPKGAEEWRWEEYRKAKGEIERAAGNAPIQGCNADMTKQALIYLYQKLKNLGLLDRIKFVACIHDEIVVESPTTYMKRAGRWLGEAMEYGAHRYLKKVPVSCQDYTIDRCWSKA
jgi:DNA polymerase I-like protein with 3'-5' exonuclease and polymerase domains